MAAAAAKTAARIQGAALVALGALAAWGALLLPPPYPGETWAGLVPLLASAALAAVGVSIMFTAQSDAAADAADASARNETSAALMLALALVYHQGVVWFGYLLATAAAAPLAFILFGVRRPRTLVAAAILCPTVLYLVFFVALNVFLQRGELFDLLDWFA